MTKPMSDSFDKPVAESGARPEPSCVEIEIKPLECFLRLAQLAAKNELSEDEQFDWASMLSFAHSMFEEQFGEVAKHAPQHGEYDLTMEEAIGITHGLLDMAVGRTRPFKDIQAELEAEQVPRQPELTEAQVRELDTWRNAARIASDWDYQRSIAVEFGRIADKLEKGWRAAGGDEGVKR